MSTIITHQRPDLDALLSAWFIQRFILTDADVAFVNTGTVTADDLADADAVVDTGKEFDPSRLRFDHHQFPGAASNDTCAALQVYQHLLANGHTVAHLEPLALLAWAGDTGRKDYGADTSRSIGLHAQLSARLGTLDDNQICAWAFAEFDLLSARLLRQQDAKAELADLTVTERETPIGKVVVLADAEPRHTYAAFEDGAVLVCWSNANTMPDGSITYAVGVNRATESTLDIGQLLLKSSAANTVQDDKWFLHPAGFFAGRGTPKAPRTDSFPGSMVDIADALSVVILASIIPRVM